MSYWFDPEDNKIVDGLYIRFAVPDTVTSKFVSTSVAVLDRRRSPSILNDQSAISWFWSYLCNKYTNFSLDILRNAL